jgi:transcription initiation factor TFIIIB Brf1 subunit/transcription initiation factor TFIIB
MSNLEDLLTKILNDLELNIPEKEVIAARVTKAIIEISAKNPFFFRNYQTKFTLAGLIYLASLAVATQTGDFSKKITQLTIADKLNIANITVGNNYKRIYHRFPECFPEIYTEESP